MRKGGGEGRGAKRAGGGGYTFSGIRAKLKSRRAVGWWGYGVGRGMKGFEVAIARNSRFARLRASAETAICIGNYTG